MKHIKHYGWMLVRPGGQYRIRECIETGAATVGYQGKTFRMPVFSGRTIAYAKWQADAELICRLMNRGRHRRVG